MVKLYLTVLSLLLVGSSGAAFADAKQDCDTFSGDAAIRACDRAIRENPRDAVSYNNRGVAYFRRAEAYRDKSDVDSAFADDAKAIEIDPKSAAAYNSRCR